MKDAPCATVESFACDSKIDIVILLLSPLPSQFTPFAGMSPFLKEK